jgi:BioD-like phosphotransacetylase family protein
MGGRQFSPNGVNQRRMGVPRAKSIYRFGAEAQSGKSVVLLGIMELPNFLDRLVEGTLVITPGDQYDLILGSLLADAASAYPRVAGLVLTGG